MVLECLQQQSQQLSTEAKMLSTPPLKLSPFFVRPITELYKTDAGGIIIYTSLTALILIILGIIIELSQISFNNIHPKAKLYNNSTPSDLSNNNAFKMIQRNDIKRSFEQIERIRTHVI